jgi:hypothetical protein
MHLADREARDDLVQLRLDEMSLELREVFAELVLQLLAVLQAPVSQKHFESRVIDGGNNRRISFHSTKRWTCDTAGKSGSPRISYAATHPSDEMSTAGAIGASTSCARWYLDWM